MSRILNRQRQLAEQGRLRLGYTTPTNSGKTRPKASHTWIVTSHSREHVEKAAELWGGQVEEWQPMGNGTKQWRVITQANTIEAILPPGDPLSQAYEMWNRGGCVRRCDGVTEQLTGSPCPCFAQYGDDWYEKPTGTVCDSKSRLKVLLPDMPGLGSWRVETGSYYATDEMAGMVDTIRGAVGDSVLVPVQLRIEPRTRVAGGQTKQFVVPVLELRGVTAGSLLSGQYAGLRAIDSGPGDERPAIAAGDGTDWHARMDACADVDELRAVWREANAAGAMTEPFKAHMKLVLDRLQPTDEDKPADEGAPAAPVEDGEPEPNPQEVWQQILAIAGERQIGLDDLRAGFATWSQGIAVEDADGFQLADYLAELTESGAA